MTAAMMTIGGIGRNGDPSGDRLTLAQHIPKNMGVNEIRFKIDNH